MHFTKKSNGLKLAEDSLSLLLLGLMILIPLIEIALRQWNTNLPGAIKWVSVFTLWFGLAGGVLATRDNKHLVLNSDVSFLGVGFGWFARNWARFVTVSVTAALAIAATRAVINESTSIERLTFGVPFWIVLIALPVGYGLMALRSRLPSTRRTELAHQDGNNLYSWIAYFVTLLLAACLLWGLSVLDWETAEVVVWPLLLILLISTTVGAPIYVVIGGSALLLFWGSDTPITAVTSATIQQLQEEILPTLPLYTFTGYLLAESNASSRLMKAFRAMFAWIPSGMAVVAIVVCAFFTTFTGASGVTILALGGVLYPVLIKEGYPERFSMGLLTSSGSIGLLFPPALPVIMYAVVAQVPIDQMFIAGIVPGLILVIALILFSLRVSLTADIKKHTFSVAELMSGIWEAKWELAIPFITMGVYFSGFASPLEAAAITATYTFLVEVLIHRELASFSRILQVTRESSGLIGGVLVIFGVAMGLTNYLNYEMVPAAILEWGETTISSKWVFLIALNIFLLAVGCVMDIFSALVVVVPLILPLAKPFGVDPIHMGIIFLANLELGYLTPPVGMNLFLSSYRFEKPLPEVYRTVIPYFFVLLFAVLLITYVPQLTMWPVAWYLSY